MDVRRSLKNIIGWSTTRKIIVIESDDWGSIRMPSRQVYDFLSEKGLNLSTKNYWRYNLYDSLATTGDLAALFDVLSRHKDKNGNSCVFTAATLVANPDFEKIKSEKFQKYYYEPFTRTLKRYKGCEHSFELWKEGIKRKVFVPELHGREHLCVAAWMKSLKAGHQDVLLAFEHGVWGFETSSCQNTSGSFQAAFDLWSLEELSYHRDILADAVRMFREIFGYNAALFVPPNFVINNLLLPKLAELEIRCVSLPRIQKEPMPRGRRRMNVHWLGKNSAGGIVTIVRNCLFEPSLGERDWVGSCLKDIASSFTMQKPAVISSHRINYIGAIDPRNRDSGLKQLDELLNRALKCWPDIEFMTSRQLADLVCKKSNS